MLCMGMPSQGSASSTVLYIVVILISPLAKAQRRNQPTLSNFPLFGDGTRHFNQLVNKIFAPERTKLNICLRLWR